MHKKRALLRSKALLKKFEKIRVTEQQPDKCNDKRTNILSSVGCKIQGL